MVFRRDLRLLACAPCHSPGAAVVERWRWPGHRRSWAGRRFRACYRHHPQCRAAADRLSVSLCFCHADRRGRSHHLVHVCGATLMASWPILSVTTFLPLVGVALIILFRGEDAAVLRNVRWIALWTTIVTFAVSLILVWRFDPGSPEFQFVEKVPWLGASSFYHMGVDGISLPFVILTTALMPLCIIASWLPIQKRVKEYMIAFLVLETLMIGTFASLDLVLFYLFFEGGLIPMFLIIGVWGGPRRVYASFKFFLYTLAGSVLMLLAIMAMYWQSGTTEIPALLQHSFPRSLQTWAWLAFLASFAVKL